jgi:hypothetical protein
MHSMRVCLLLLSALLLMGNQGGATSAAAPPTIAIYSPYEGGPAIAGNHLLVQVTITGYRLDGLLLHRPAPAGVGYWMLRIDGADAGLAVTDMIMAPNAALPRLTAGAHRIGVELVDSQGVPLMPPVFQEATITLANDMIFDPGSTGAPAISIILPADGAQVAPEHLYVKVRLTNARPDARPASQSDPSNIGPWWLTVDGAYAGLSMSEIIDLPNDALPTLAPGPHTLAASLRLNDGSPLPGATGSSIRVVVTGCSACPPAAPTPTAEPDPAQGCDSGRGQWFAATGHTVCPPFLPFWNRYGGLPQFGYPLTDALRVGAITVQYFERARFEWHPELPAPFQVSLGLLGREVSAGRTTEPAFQPQPAAPGAVLYFPQTGQQIAAEFAAYWQAHGGLPIYGYPISAAFTEISPTDGQPALVQYFERNRFEWHPALATPFRVSLGLLGAEILRQQGGAP